MKKTLTAILLFCATGFSARAQTPYVPTCLTPAQVATVTQSTAALAPILLFDETDAALRLADAQCNNVKVATGLLADVAQAKADIAALKAVAPVPGPQGIPGIKGDKGDPGIPGSALPPGTVNFTSTQITASSPAVRLDFASCVPTSQVVGWISAGQTVDFTVPISLAGNYLLSACVSSTGGATYHFEFPIGTKVGSSLTAPNTAAWHIYGQQSATATVALPVGNAVIRVVFETAGLNFGGGTLVKQ